MQQADETGDMERTSHQPVGVTFASIYRRKKAMLTLGQAALEDARNIWHRESECCLSSMKPPAFSAVMAIRKTFAAAKCTGIQ